MASRVDKIYGDAYISVKTDEDDLLEALEEAKAVKEILDSNTDFREFPKSSPDHKRREDGGSKERF